MKFLNSISVLSLITLSNVSAYIQVSEGTCLKINKGGKLVPKSCSKASEFILQNNKLCEKKDTSSCLSDRNDGRTKFSTEADIHANNLGFNSACGCLQDYADNLYSFSPLLKMFIKRFPGDGPTDKIVDTVWKHDGFCWTSYVNKLDTKDKIILQKCRTATINKNQGKNQSWRFEDGVIKTSDGTRCVKVYRRKVYTMLCSSGSTPFVYADFGIHIKDFADKCLSSKFGSKKLTMRSCYTKIKLLESITVPTYKHYKLSNVVYSQEGNTVSVGIDNSYSSKRNFGQLVILQNFNYYTIEINKATTFTNFGLASADQSQFIDTWVGDMGLKKKNSISSFSSTGLAQLDQKYIFNYLGSKYLITSVTAQYLTGAKVKVVKTDTYVEFRCLSCGDTLIHKHTFREGDYKQLFPALDVHFTGDSYSICLY